MRIHDTIFAGWCDTQRDPSCRWLVTPMIDALTGPGCVGPDPNEAQGEAVTFTADATGFVTVSEGVNPSLHTSTLP